MSKKIFFLSGIPRSGSVLLASILAQNPKFHTTSTSPLYGLLKNINDNWNIYSSNLNTLNLKQKNNVCKSVFNSYYKHVDKDIILDKSRGWPSYINFLKDIDINQPKILASVRDIPEVISSLFSVYNKDNPNYFNATLDACNLKNNNLNKCKIIWDQKKIVFSKLVSHNGVSIPWNSLKYGYENFKKYIHLIDYNDLINDPNTTLKNIYNFLEIDPYKKHKFKNLINNSPEPDKELYGATGIHDIYPVLKRYSKPAKEILGEETYNYFYNQKLEFWKK